MVIRVPDTGMGQASVIHIGPIVCIAYGMIIPAVRSVVYQAESNGRADEISVERPVHIMPVIDINKAGIVGIHACGIVKDMQAAQAVNLSVPIPDINPADLGNTPVIVVVYRDILHLNYGSIIVILHERIIIKAGIEGYGGPAEIHSGTNLNPIFNVEVKFPVRIYREGNSIFHKDEWVSIAGCKVFNCIFRGCSQGKSGSQDKR